MDNAVQAFANYKRAAVGDKRCPVRAEVLWGVSMGDDPWGHLRYQYCHFTVGDDACSIGMTFASPVYVSCIRGREQRAYLVSARGGVTAVGGGNNRHRRHR
jgi:hypothetical protein